MAGRPRPDACEICANTNRKICYDHCHRTGRFRGWLCDSCNAALGMAAENPGILRRLADYIENHEKTPGSGIAPQKYARKITPRTRKKRPSGFQESFSFSVS